MKRKVSEKMIKLNKAAIWDEQYRELMEDYKEVDIRFQAAMNRLSQEDRDAIFNYFGAIIEMKNRLLMISLQLE